MRYQFLLGYCLLIPSLVWLFFMTFWSRQKWSLWLFYCLVQNNNIWTLLKPFALELFFFYNCQDIRHEFYGGFLLNIKSLNSNFLTLLQVNLPPLFVSHLLLSTSLDIFKEVERLCHCCFYNFGMRESHVHYHFYYSSIVLVQGLTATYLRSGNNNLCSLFC